MRTSATGGGRRAAEGEDPFGDQDACEEGGVYCNQAPKKKKVTISTDITRNKKLK
jgi:hypothetical protein